LAFGGEVPTITTATEEYDGTTWTSVNCMNTARNYLAAAGIQTAALGFGGNTTVPVSTTEEYDGTSWSNNFYEYSKRGFSRSRNSNICFSFWWKSSRSFKRNRRMDRCRSSGNKNNNSKLIWQII
jgi:hypothetical protein